MAPLRPLAFLLLTVATGACGSGPDIRGTDRDALLASGRVYVDLARRAPEGDGARPIRGIELEVAGVQGNFENSQTGRADYDFLQSHVAFRFGAQTEHVEFFGLAGATVVHFDGHSSRGVRSDDEEFGATAGFQCNWRATGWLVPFARTALAQFTEDAHGTRTEVGVEFRPCAGMGMYVGYGWWSYERENRAWPEPDIDVRTEGLLVGLELRF